MTYLHISVPAITRGTLARPHELKKGQTQFFFQEANAILIVWPGLNIPCLKILYKYIPATRFR